MPAIIYLFTLTNLIIGTGAFAISGILQPIGTALGVSVAVAGQAITAYALASAFLAPLAMVATGKWPRKRAIMAALGIFLLGTLLCIVSTSFYALLLGRALMGVGAMFSAMAAGVAVAIAPPALRARAIALTFMGISLSYAIGVPMGAWLGFAYGWKVPMVVVAACGGLVLLALAFGLPRNIAAPGASFAGLGTAIRHGAIVRVWLRTLLYFLAIFSVFAYVGPVMQALVPMTAQQLSLTLGLFGVSGVVGTFLGGWAADRFGPIAALRVNLGVFTVMMLCVPLTQGHYPLVASMFILWGIAGFSMGAPQQVRLAMLSPSQAPMLLSLNSSMLYLGTALGAAISGALLGTVGFDKLAWVGAPFAFLAYCTLWFDKDMVQVT